MEQIERCLDEIYEYVLIFIISLKYSEPIKYLFVHSLVIVSYMASKNANFWDIFTISAHLNPQFSSSKYKQTANWHWR